MYSSHSLIGRLGHEPELRFTRKQGAITTLRIATNTYRKNADTGQQESVTTWHRCVFFDKQAELVCDKAQKGDVLFVEGVPVDRSWNDKHTKVKVTVREIKVNSVKFPAGFTKSSQISHDDQVDEQIEQQLNEHQQWIADYEAAE